MEPVREVLYLWRGAVVPKTRLHCKLRNFRACSVYDVEGQLERRRPELLQVRKVSSIRGRTSGSCKMRLWEDTGCFGEPVDVAFEVLLLPNRILESDCWLIMDIDERRADQQVLLEHSCR